jgi:DNA recombination protein RmuC
VVEAVSLLLALLIGGALGFWISHSVARTRTDLEALRARELDERLRTAEAARELVRGDLSVAQQRTAQLEATLTHERETRAKMESEFKSLSSDALARNTQEFLKLARTTFDSLQQQSVGELEKRQQAVEALVRPIRESLDKVDTKIGEIEKARANAYGQLSEQLKSLGSAQIALQVEAAKLATALRSTTTAGTWGELQLRRVIELSGMTSYCDFLEQQTANALRPDVVVRLPGNQQIVIDAKAPNDAYREAVNSGDELIRASKLAEHATKVRAHIDSLGAKEYWAQFQPSPEFVVMFLPGDQFLAGALQSDPSLVDRAITRRVLLATPASLIALLKAAAYGWRQEAISKNAEAIGALGRELYERFATFAEHLHKTGRNLDAAVRGYNAAVGSFETALLPGARRFAELGVKGGKDLELPGLIDTAPREVIKRE